MIRSQRAGTLDRLRLSFLEGSSLEPRRAVAGRWKLSLEQKPSSSAALQDLQAATATALWDPVKVLQFVFMHQHDMSVYSKLLCTSSQFQALRPAAGSLSISVTADHIPKASGHTVAEKVTSILAWVSKALNQGTIKHLHFEIDSDWVNLWDDSKDSHGLLSCGLSQLLSEVAADPQTRQKLPQSVSWCDAHGYRLETDSSAVLTTLSHLAGLNITRLKLQGIKHSALQKVSPCGSIFPNTVQCLELPDLTLEPGCVLPTGLSELTVGMLPDAVTLLSHLTALQKLHLTDLHNPTARTLLPVLQILPSLRQFSVKYFEGRNPWDVIPETLSTWSLFKSGLPLVHVRWGQLGCRPDVTPACVAQSNHDPAHALTVALWGYNRYSPALLAARGPAPLQHGVSSLSGHLQLLPTLPASVGKLQIDTWTDRCGKALVTPAEFASAISGLPHLCSVKLNNMRLRKGSSCAGRCTQAYARGEELLPVTLALGGLRSLQKLSLFDCLLTDDLVVPMVEALGSANSLHYLCIGREKDSLSPRLTDTVMVAIAVHLMNLQTLIVQHHCIKPDGVRALERRAQLQALAVTGSARVQEAVADVCPYNLAG